MPEMLSQCAGYGMTETSIITYFPEASKLSKPQSVGVPIFNTEVKVNLNRLSYFMYCRGNFS